MEVLSIGFTKGMAAFGGGILFVFFYNFFAEKSCRQNQDRAKSWKMNFQYFFELNFDWKKAATETKTVPKAGNIKFVVLF